jgi:hypothetical protein
MFAVAGSASAQGPGPVLNGSIDPGMNRDLVIARLGKPSSEHTSGNKTYLYYPNGQERKMGMSDMVALEDGKVVDAVFRSPSRKYTGQSSSPRPVSEEAAIVKGGGKPSTKPMKIPAPPAKVPAKAVPPTKRAPEPMKKVDAKKIEAPAKKTDTTKKAPPAPAKKP